MNDILRDLLLGIFSGLVGAGLILYIRSNWEKIIIPWYEERIYKDAHVEGRWDGEVTHSTEDAEPFTLYLNRNSHRVYGEMFSKQNGKMYKINGEFRNMILTLTYTATQLSAVDRGCFTFLLVNNGKELQGYGAFYYSPEHRIAAAPTKLSRAE